MKLLLYCTKNKPYLIKCDDWHLDNKKQDYYWKQKQVAPFQYNGYIVAECDYDVEEIRIVDDEIWNWWYETKTLSKNELCEKSCLSEDEIYDYLEENEGYATHIKNLHIFDKPKELWNYVDKDAFSIEKAPQNMMYVFDENIDEYEYDEDGKLLENKCVLISIHPEWLCKILNGEKTIEVRKKVLKEMLECQDK